MPRSASLPAARPVLATAAASVGVALALLAVPMQAAAQSCRLVERQKSPCAVLPADRLAAALELPPGELKTSDNVAIMGSMPEMTSCIVPLPRGGEVRIGQFARSTVPAFEQRYRVQSDAEIAAAAPAGTAQAEKAVGRTLGANERAAGQAGATAMLKGMQYEAVAGLGDRARVIYSGNLANAHLVTLVKGETFFVQANVSRGTRTANLALARSVAEAVLATCR